MHIFRDLNVNVPDIEQFIGFYKSIYFDYIDDSALYPGTEKVLKTLNDKNIRISLLTTKGQEQAEKIMEYFTLGKYFDVIMGRRAGMEIKPSAVPLLTICKELNVLPEETLMIGDSELDIQCGKNANAKTCGVTYGYRTIEDLLRENPDYLISKPNEIINLI